MTEAPEWIAHLEFLLAGTGRGLEGGAELEVSDPSEEVVFLAPLARHSRLDEEGVLWVRPVLGGYEPVAGEGMPAYAFSLSAARRPGLRPLDVRREGEDLVLQLDSGRRARIRPAGADTVPELEGWDTFYLLLLTAQEEAGLDSLWGDSYVGRWE